MLNTINKNWNWTGAVAIEIFAENDFGNVIFKSEKGNYWRICPEELSCKIIAGNLAEMENLFKNPNFMADWEMVDFVILAKHKLGDLKSGQKYCLKLPGVLGGQYQEENFGLISTTELLSFSGDLGLQIKDLPDGSKFEFSLT